jgi:hypothetical protein
MGKLVRRRPSPSLVISIVALVVALTGTAVAGVATISKLSKSEKTKVRGLADQEIDKKAPGLSVKSATTAGDVTNQMWAVIGPSAGLVRSTPGITGAALDTSGPGKYIVSANRDLTSCYSVANVGGDEPGIGSPNPISVNPFPGDNRSLYVYIGANHSFTILIRC